MIIQSDNRKWFSLIFCCLLISPIAKAQNNPIRPFTSVFSGDLKGGSTIFGNTIMHIVDGSNNVNLTKMNAPTEGADPSLAYGNDGENMQFIDIDQVAATKNSSAANLVLPAGTNKIRFAKLYWGGRLDTTGIVNVPDTLKKVKLRFNNNSYVNINGFVSNVDQSAVLLSNRPTTQKIYQARADITQLVNLYGAGTYTIADIPTSTGTIANGGYYGGWAIVVVYENLAEPFNSVRVFDGFAKLAAGSTSSSLAITLTGLNVPNRTLTADEAVMGAVVWEGDANLGSSTGNPAGDYIKINNITASNGLNAATNFWNGSITKKSLRVTSKNPNYVNQMGIDIDEVNAGVGYNILPNATSVSVQFGTEADTYFPSIFTFNIRAKETTLPVKLSGFTARLIDNNHSLVSWTTLSEINADRFEVQRSEDGTNFISAGIIKSRGAAQTAQHYSFNDRFSSSAPVLYYRLNSIDRDNSSQYSTVEIVRLKSNPTETGFEVFPNPFRNQLKVISSSSSNTSARINILSYDGKILLRQNNNLVKGSNFIQIENTEKLPKGNYLIEISTPFNRQIRKITRE